MFTYVSLKNFMSFKDVCFDFRKSNSAGKSFAAIYGENGSGKSNFVTSIDFLKKSIESFVMMRNTDKLIEAVNNKEFPQELLDLFLSSNNIEKYREECKMIESDEPTTVEYGFECNGHEGYYISSFKDRFIYEKLYYFTGKQRGVLYELDATEGRVYLSDKLFGSAKAEADIKDEINKYWGKHTLLSIFNKEKYEKNEEYIHNSYLSYVFDVINMFDEGMVRRKIDDRDYLVEIGKPYSVVPDLKKGKIIKSNESILDRSERIVKDFFTQTYADIKDVYYERLEENDQIAYKLFVKKMIAGQIRTIDFSKESSGTQHILEIIRSLLGAFCGVTVVYDEIDDGIHDLLLKTVIDSMVDDITGQLIITTHNTYLLETIDPKSAYVINIDYNGDKEVKCLDKFKRIQGTNNARLMYLKGLFGGIPSVDMLDYDAIIDEINSSEEDGGKA